MDGRKAGCLLVALVTVVCIQQAGVVLSVLGRKRENRVKKTKRHQRTTREDKDKIQIPESLLHKWKES